MNKKTKKLTNIKHKMAAEKNFECGNETKVWQPIYKADDVGKKVTSRQ